MRKLFLILSILGLLSCGTSRDKSGKNETSPIQETQSPKQQPSSPIPSQDVKTTVYFLPLSIHLGDIEKYKLCDTFKTIGDERKGYWIIVGHSIDDYLSLRRARRVEHFLRHKLHYDVVGIVQGKTDGDFGTVDVTFTHY